MDTAQTLVRFARSFFAGTALSRVTGFLRDVAMAISFGSTAEVAAFFVAFRLSNLFRRLLGEGNLQSGFVPQFAAMQEKGAEFFRDALYSLGALLIGVIVLSEGVCFGIRHFVGVDWDLILELTMWMLPGLFFICLFGLNTALLQCRQKYFLPSAAPIAFNFAWIAAALYTPDVRFLALAVTVGFFGQWLVTFFEGMRLLSLKEWLKPRLFSPECRALFKPLTLGLIGVGAVQFNSALDPIFARIADLKAPAFLWYAIRIQQLPFALFALALSSALLPALARTTDPAGRKELLESALKEGAKWMLFSTFGLIALGKAGINLFYGHGGFTPLDVEETYLCLWGYGVGLLPACFVLLLAAHSYAAKDYKTPALASLWAVLANIALNALFVLVFNWGAFSVALATSLSSLLNMALLARGSLTRNILNPLIQMGAWTGAAALICLLIEQVFVPFPPREITSQVFHCAILGIPYLVMNVKLLIK